MQLANLLLLLLITFTSASSAHNAFEEGMSYAKLPERQNTHTQALAKFEPQESLTSEHGAYTENPPQVDYYTQSQSNTNKLKQDSSLEITKDESYLDVNGNPVPTPGKAITTAFVSRPVVGITGKEEFMQKGKIITTNAENIVTGSSNKHVNCQKQKMSTCKTVNVEKSCNEAKILHKVCEKIPEITVTKENVTYHDCKKIIITQGTTIIPNGYKQLLYADMIRFVNWDDIRIYQKKTRHHHKEMECLGGYLVRGIDGNTSLLQSTKHAVVPKKMHSRIKFSNFFDHSMIVTIKNKTTGKILYDAKHFSAGQVVELPFSTTQDQTFSFHDHGLHGNANPGRGVMILYVDHINSEKVATTTWKDLPCHYE